MHPHHCNQTVFIHKKVAFIKQKNELTEFSNISKC